MFSSYSAIQTISYWNNQVLTEHKLPYFVHTTTYNKKAITEIFERQSILRALFLISFDSESFIISI